MAGFVAARVDGERRIGEIVMVAVDPGSQGHGVGGALTEFATGWLREQGMRVAMVETGGDAGHAAARRVHERAGYQLLPVARYFKNLQGPAPGTRSAGVAEPAGQVTQAGEPRFPFATHIFDQLAERPPVVKSRCKRQAKPKSACLRCIQKAARAVINANSEMIVEIAAHTFRSTASSGKESRAQNTHGMSTWSQTLGERNGWAGTARAPGTVTGG